MADLQRYDIWAVPDDAGIRDGHMDDGEWVRAEDAIHRIAELELANLELTQQLKDLAAKRMADMDKVRVEMVRRHEQDLEKWDTERAELERQLADTRRYAEQMDGLNEQRLIEANELRAQLATERAGRQHEGERADRLREERDDARYWLKAASETSFIRDIQSLRMAESRARLVRLVRAKTVQIEEHILERSALGMENYDLEQQRDSWRRVCEKLEEEKNTLQLDWQDVDDCRTDAEHERDTLSAAVSAWVAQSDSIAARQELLKVWQDMEPK